MKTTALYTFRWIGGGYNQVYAPSKKEALALIKQKFPSYVPDLKSFRRLTGRHQIEEYYRSIWTD